MYDCITLEIADGVATITLNRPDKLNAYTPEMGEELVHAFHAVRDDPAVRAVVLTGAGRGFCAGVDLERLKQDLEGGKGSASRIKIGEEAFVQSFPQELYAFPKPVIVAINGAAVGVGVTMSLPCDIRLAAQSAKLGLTFTKLGMLPGLGSTHLLPQLVGMVRAKELVLTGRVIRADEAERIGLVNAVVPDAELLETARAMAAEIASRDPAVIAAAKRALHFGADADLAGAMRNEQAESAGLRARRG